MININVTERTNSRTKAKMYVGQVNTNSLITLDEIVDRISARCTVTKSDVLAVIAAFREQSVYAIRNGQSVSLGSLGTLYPRINTKMAETAEDFKATNIKSVNVGFRAGKQLRQKLQRGQEGIVFNVIRPESAPSTPPAQPGTQEPTE